MSSNVRLIAGTTSRRDFLRQSTALGLVVSTGALTACTDEALSIIILLAKLAFTIAEEITGDVKFQNLGNSVQYIEGAICLIRKGAGGDELVQELSAFFEVPPGESSIPFGQLFADEEGKHQVEVLTGVGDWFSDTFQVRG